MTSHTTLRQLEEKLDVKVAAVFRELGAGRPEAHARGGEVAPMIPGSVAQAIEAR